MKRPVRLFLVLVLLSIAGLFPDAAFAEKQTFQLVTEELPPYSFLEHEKNTGISVDIVREILKSVGHPDNIKIMTWSRAYNLTVENDNYALFSTARTKEREKLFKWVGPIVTDLSVFLCKKGNKAKFTNVEDARKAKAIGVYKDDFLNSHLASIGFNNLESVIDDKMNLKKLASGRIDLWAASGFLGDYLLHKEGLSGEIERAFIYSTDDLYLAFSKNTPDEMINEWQKALDDLKKSPRYSKIMNNYGIATENTNVNGTKVEK